MVVFATAAAAVLVLAGCNDAQDPTPAKAGQSEGEKLARQYCAACHVYPEPDILTRRSWTFLLTQMGLRMGIEDLSSMSGATPLELEMIQNRKTLIEAEGKALSVPMVSDEQWALIRAFYMESAPETALPQADKPALSVGLDLFEPRGHGYGFKEPMTSMVHIDEANRQLFVGDSFNQELTVLDKDLKQVFNQLTPGFNWLRADVREQGVYLLSIGDLMGSARDHRIGDVFYALRKDDSYTARGVALDGLHRPAAMDFGDFDGDGVEEVVVCNFGFGKGSVDIHKADINGWQFEKTPAVTLATELGAVDCEVADFDKDGRTDIAVLFSDARENLSIFLNKGGGTFERHYIVNSHSAFGYVGFRWGDFNNDGHLDVWTINGDNVDSDPYNTLKPYHGVRLYLGKGDLVFEESYFYPMYGVYGLEIEDFDLDGDLDLAMISNNPDYDAEINQGFVYLENTGPGEYSAKTFESPFTDRWLTMDAGDLDGDGDKDLVLGGAYMEAGLAVDKPELLEKMREEATSLLVLENKTK